MKQGWLLHAPLPAAIVALILIGGMSQPARAHEARRGAPSDETLSAGMTPEDRPAEIWRCPMCESVRQDHPGRCPKCGMDLVVDTSPTAAHETGKTPAGRVGGHAADPSRPLMPGVPPWLFYATSLSILGLSFFLFEFRGRRRDGGREEGRRFNLMAVPLLRALVARPWFRLVLQVPVVLLFALVIAAGFAGNPSPGRNIATVLTWTIWWTWLVIAILFVGKLWCTACPWMAIADWVGALIPWRRGDGSIGLEKRWPRGLRNIWLATLLFVGLTWLELGFGVTEKPWLTAFLGLVMVAASVLTILVFERKAFCRYACLVGRVSGLYSMFAASELRAADRDICRHCSTHDCYHGSGAGRPCPTGQFIGAMDANTYCILCMECVRTCSKDNIAWNVRPLGADLVEGRRTRVDEAYLAVIMLSMSAFHGLTMTPTWDRMVGAIESVGGASWLVAFSAGMAGMILLPLAVYYGVCVLMKALAGDGNHSAGFLFVRFSYSLLPIALFYHLAHNLQHIFFEGKKLVRVASDPFGWGWDLFGTAHMLIDSILPLNVGWGIQVGLILIGHVYGILIAHQVANAIYDNHRTATLSQVPMLLAMLLFSFQSLWLLTQPMMMRSSM